VIDREPVGALDAAVPQREDGALANLGLAQADGQRLLDDLEGRARGREEDLVLGAPEPQRPADAARKP